MREGRYNNIKNMMQTRLDRVSKHIAGDFKGARPFDKIPTSTDEQLEIYQSNGYEMFQHLADAYGVQKAQEWQQDMEEKLLRRELNAQQ